MPQIYKLLTGLLAFTGTVSLLLSGEMNPAFSVVGMGLFPGYYQFLRSGLTAPKWTVSLLSFLTLIVFGFDALVSRDLFLAVAHLTIAFQVIKAFDLRDPWDHLQVYFVSLLQLVIASELMSSLVFGGVFIVFIVLLVAAMVLSHFLTEGGYGMVKMVRPVTVITVVTICTTALFFVLLPRTPYRFVGKSHFRSIRTAGFSERVEFGSFGTVKLDPTVIMRIEMEGRRAGMDYWRGLTMDFFDGTTWRHSERDRIPVSRKDDTFVIIPFRQEDVVAQKIFLEPIDSDVIFCLAPVKAIKAESFRLFVDRERAVFLPGKASRKTVYTAYSSPGEKVPGIAEQRYLQLPGGIQKIRDLAGRIASGGSDDRGRASLIEEYLKKNYVYSLTVRRPPARVGPIEDFLFTSRRGYCEHYATSMVLLLRALGIPARIVNGFHGGETNEFGNYLIVRQSDAHSWVEALIGGYWVRFDPTPSAQAAGPSVSALLLDSITMAWSRYVVGFSAEDQRKILRSVALPVALPSLREGMRLKWNPYFFLPLLIFILVVLFIRVRRRRAERYGFATVQFLKLVKVLRSRGFNMPSPATGRDIRERVAGSALAGTVHEFIRLYEENRFGSREVTPQDRKRYAAMLRQIRTLPLHY